MFIQLSIIKYYSNYPCWKRSFCCAFFGLRGHVVSKQRSVHSLLAVIARQSWVVINVPPCPPLNPTTYQPTTQGQSATLSHKKTQPMF